MLTFLSGSRGMGLLLRQYMQAHQG
eukprot:gene15458-18671_t